jgi:DNA polymerase-3 subunit alpha
MAASVDEAVNAIQRAARSRESGQHGLFFGGSSAPAHVEFELRDAAPWSEGERLASEYAMLGFYVSGHPLARYSSRLEEMKAITIDQVEGQRNNKEITIAALIVGSRPMRSRKGARWGIFTLQDMTGVQELLVFPEAFTRFEAMLKPGVPLLLKARVQIEEAGTRLSLQEARRLEDLADRQVAPKEFRVKLDVRALNNDLMDRLESAFDGCPGNCPVVFELTSPDGSVALLPSQQRVRLCAELQDSVRRICGEEPSEMAVAV